MGIRALRTLIGFNGPDQPYLGLPHPPTSWRHYLSSALRFYLSYGERMFVFGPAAAVFGYG